MKAEGSLCHGAWETLIKGQAPVAFSRENQQGYSKPCFCLLHFFLRCGPTPGVLVSVCTHNSTEEPRRLLLDNLEKHVVAVKHESQLSFGTTV